MQHKTYKAAIFDMDGTVLNTLEDLTSALNHSPSPPILRQRRTSRHYPRLGH